MTYREAFVAGVQRLHHGPVGTETPELDARVLLGHATGLAHAGLLARWSDELEPGAWDRYSTFLGRRSAGEPVAWITGIQEFLGMDFEVGPGVLVPRPDTEILVEAALSLEPRGRVVDVCTGTGCVALGIAALAPQPLEVWAGDVSPVALETAGRNARRLGLPPRGVTVVASHLLDQLPGPWDLVVSNPPYLTTAETLERTGPRGWREPSLALDGGPDGLDLIRRLVASAAPALAPGGWLLLEAAGPQMSDLRRIFSAEGFRDLRTWFDLGGVERVIGGRRAGTSPSG